MNKQSMENGAEFKIRSYGRTELALLYSPELSALGAFRRLQRWMLRSPGLMQRLEDLGYDEHNRSFTPLEVRVIVEALGEP